MLKPSQHEPKKYFEINQISDKDNFRDTKIKLFMSKKLNNGNKINEIAEKINDIPLSDE